MVAGAEEQGGIERYVDAVKLKSEMFSQALADDVENLEIETFKGCVRSWPRFAGVSGRG